MVRVARERQIVLAAQLGRFELLELPDPLELLELLRGSLLLLRRSAREGPLVRRPEIGKELAVLDILRARLLLDELLHFWVLVEEQVLERGVLLRDLPEVRVLADEALEIRVLLEGVLGPPLVVADDLLLAHRKVLEILRANAVEENLAD